MLKASKEKKQQSLGLNMTYTYLFHLSKCITLTLFLVLNGCRDASESSTAPVEARDQSEDVDELRIVPAPSIPEPEVLRERLLGLCEDTGEDFERFYPSLYERACEELKDSPILLGNIHSPSTEAEAIEVVNDRQTLVSTFGSLFPMVFETAAFDMYSFIGTGLMKKSIGFDNFDDSVTTRSYRPQLDPPSHLHSRHLYNLRYARSFGNLDILPSELEMLFDRTYQSESEVFLIADRRKSGNAMGLIRDWQLYFMFREFEEGQTMGFLYIQIDIVNLGLPGFVEEEYNKLIKKLSPLVYRSVERLK